MTPYEKKTWFYLTRGMIQGLFYGERTPENLENILIQFNKIAPELNIPEADIPLKEITINAV